MRLRRPKSTTLLPALALLISGFALCPARAADQTYYGRNSVDSVPKKLHDMGDGTFADTLWIGGSGTQYASGATAASPTGTVVFGKTATNTLIALLVDTLGDLLVLPQATENHLGSVGGDTITVSSTITRPADTNAYSVNDAFASSTSSPVAGSFANACRVAGGTAYLTKLRLQTDQAANVARFRFNVKNGSSAPAINNDNAAYTRMFAESDALQGYIDMPAMQPDGTGSDSATSQALDVRMQVSCSPGSTTLYWDAEALDIFTPGSGQRLKAIAAFDRN